MNVYGDLAFMFSVVEKQRVMSCPREEFERRGLRRRGIGRAIGVGVWEGMVSDSFSLQRFSVADKFLVRVWTLGLGSMPEKRFGEDQVVIWLSGLFGGRSLPRGCFSWASGGVREMVGGQLGGNQRS
jgi:hypothetical protein